MQTTAKCTCGWHGEYGSPTHCGVAATAHGVKHKLAAQRGENVYEIITTSYGSKFVYSREILYKLTSCYGDDFRSEWKKVRKDMSRLAVSQ